MSGASSMAPGGAPDDGTRVMSFRHGRVRKSNMKGVAKLQKKLVPINTHLIGKMESIQNQSSGTAKWTIYPIGTPENVNDILNKAYNVSVVVGKGSTDNQSTATGPLAGKVGGVPTAIGAVYNPVTAEVVTAPTATVDVSSLQNQINNLAGRIGNGMINQGIDGRFTVYSHDTYMEVKNQVTTSVNLVVYECVPRENIMKTASFNDFNTVLQTGFARKSIATDGCMDYNHRDATLYMNPVWCHHFQIAKARAVTLKCGETLKLHMTHGKSRIINPMVLGSELPYMALRNFTRVLVIKQVGTLVSNGADSALVDTSGSSLDVKITTKYRWNAMAKATEMITRTLPDAQGWTLANQIAASNISGFARPVDEDEDGPDLNVRTVV